MKLAYCIYCGDLFVPKRSTAKFCNAKHRVAFSREQETEYRDYQDSIEHSAELIKQAYPEAFVQLHMIEKESGRAAFERGIMAIRSIIATETNN